MLFRQPHRRAGDPLSVSRKGYYVNLGLTAEMAGRCAEGARKAVRPPKTGDMPGSCYTKRCSDSPFDAQHPTERFSGRAQVPASSYPACARRFAVRARNPVPWRFSTEKRLRAPSPPAPASARPPFSQVAEALREGLAGNALGRDRPRAFFRRKPPRAAPSPPPPSRNRRGGSRSCAFSPIESDRRVRKRLSKARMSGKRRRSGTASERRNGGRPAQPFPGPCGKRLFGAFAPIMRLRHNA